VFPGGVATSPDGSQQVQFPGQQFSGQLPPLQLPPIQQQPPAQQLPVQQLPVQQLPGQPAGQGQFNAGNPGAAGAANPGLNIINQLLTTPRPPPSGIAAATATNNQTIGGGLAGVASMFTGATIKSYGGRTDYSEWEFVFQLPQQTGMPANGQPQNGQQPNGQPQNGQPQSFQPFPGPGGAGMPPPPSGPPPPPPPGGFPAIPSLPH